jgi:hypothetical protein
VLSKQAFYCLIYAYSPFCFNYFWGGKVSLFAKASLDGHPILSFLPSLNDKCALPCPDFFHKDGVSQTILPGVAWSHNLLSLSLPNS